MEACNSDCLNAARRCKGKKGILLDVCFQTGKDCPLTLADSIKSGRLWRSSLQPRPHIHVCAKLSVLFYISIQVQLGLIIGGLVLFPVASRIDNFTTGPSLAHVGDDLTAHCCALSYPTDHWFRIGRCTAMPFVCISSLQL